MGDIYANSLLTLAAAAASANSCGWNCDRNHLEVAPCRIQASWEDAKRYDIICYETTGWQRYVESAALSERAWVVRERLLSPRTIHFAADQVYWECTSLRASEFLPHSPIPDQPDNTADQTLKRLIHPSKLKTDGAASFNDAWTEILRLYTRCELTHESARIVAMAGIVNALCEAFHLDRADLIMGLWKSRLPHYLLWTTEGVENVREPWHEAPSWSWLSFGGSAEYHPDLFSSVPLVLVLEVNVNSIFP